MKKELYFKVIGVIVILSVLFFLIFGLNLIKKSKESSTLIVGNSTFKYQQNRWSVLDTTVKKENNWRLFNTYVDNEHFGKYYVYSDGDEWYLFEKDKTAINYEGELLAFDNDKYKVLTYEQNEITDFTDIEKVLVENNILFNPTYTSSYYIDLDIDNDKEMERLYVISNLFPIDPISDNIFFSIVFLKKNDKIIKLYEQKEDDSFSGCKASVSSIIDLNHDNKYELILKCTYYSTNGVDYSLYNFNKDNFHKLVSS